MAEIISMKARPVEEIIQELEVLLSQAKSGEIQGILFCGVLADGCVFHGWRVKNQNVLALGAMKILDRDYTETIGKCD